MFSATETFGQQLDLLVHRADASALRVDRIAQAQLFAVERQHALVEREHSRDRFDERGLASAVLAHKRMNLAGEHAEVDGVDGGVRAKAHRCAGEF